MGRGGCERPAAHLRWLPCGTCPGASANWLPRCTNPDSGAKCRNVLAQSCYRPGHDDRPRILSRKAVLTCQSALGLRVTAPTVVFALAVAVEIPLAQAVEITVAQAVEIALSFILVLAFDVTVTIRVEDRLRSVT